LIEERILTAFLRFNFNRLLKLNPVNFTRLPPPAKDANLMLYLHVPFCESLCPYCSFHRFVCNEDSMHEYFRLLRLEMSLLAQLDYRFESVYIGGGTPTILVDELIQCIDLARELFGVKEVSCETNPNHLIPEKMDALQGRVQRLSVGVQSFDHDLLRQMQRLEKYGSGEQILKRIERIAGYFPTLNLDLIFNFPSQTEAVLQADIEKAVGSAANQVTFYPLMTSPLVSQSLARTIGTVNSVNEYAYYRQIQQGLETHFTPKSAWTFARKGEGMIDEYIADGNDYVGAGSGAFSFLNGTLYVNSFSLASYRKALKEGHLPLSKSLSFSQHNGMRYYFLMNLFGLHFDKKAFKKKFGLPVEVALPMELVYLGAAGSFVRNDANQIRLTPKGRYMTLVMMREFFSSMDNIRQVARLDIRPEEIAEYQQAGKSISTFLPAGNKSNS